MDNNLSVLSSMSSMSYSWINFYMRKLNFWNLKDYIFQRQAFLFIYTLVTDNKRILVLVGRRLKKVCCIIWKIFLRKNLNQKLLLNNQIKRILSLLKSRIKTPLEKINMKNRILLKLCHLELDSNDDSFWCEGRKLYRCQIRLVKEQGSGRGP